MISAEERLMLVLARHVGRENCISAAELYRKAFRRPCQDAINDTREMRLLIMALRRRGEPICSVSDKYNPGYYLAVAWEEMEAFCRRLERRGLASLAQVAKLRRLALPDLLGQLRLEAQEQG
jgi:hypothetical protein